jgi:hypothetical protein
MLLCCVSVRGGVIGWWGRVVASVEESLLGNTKAVVMGASPRTGGCRVVNINGHRFFQVSLAEEELTGVAGLDNYVVLYEGKKNGNYGNYGIVGQPARNYTITDAIRRTARFLHASAADASSRNDCYIHVAFWLFARPRLVCDSTHPRIDLMGFRAGQPAKASTSLLLLSAARLVFQLTSSLQ